jgi:hypothetical protein
MLSIIDCLGMHELSPDELEAIAEHERLPFIVALEKGATIMDQSWGQPAVRQMVRDNLAHAQNDGQLRRVPQLRDLYLRTCMHLPGGIDRRHGHRM